MDFKLHEKCASCSKYKKECKGYQFSVEVISLFCKQHENKNKERKNEK